MNYPKVNIILLNYNGVKDTIECLESLRCITYPNYNIVVVDNNSTDESFLNIDNWCKNQLSGIRKVTNFSYKKDNLKVHEYNQNDSEKSKKKIGVNDFFSKITLIKSNKNLGFAGGNNIGIEYSLKFNSDYILLLNNDTLVENNFLDHLVECLEGNNSAASAPAIYKYPEKKKIWFYKGRRNWYKGLGLNIDYTAMAKSLEKPIKTDFLTGCCMLLNTNLLKDQDLLKLDEDYFLYYEDDDFSAKIRNHNLDLLFCPNSKIYHKVSASVGKTNPILSYYFTRNRLLFMKKNSPNIIYSVTFNIFFIITRLVRLTQWLISGEYDNIKMMLKGFYDYYFSNFGKYESDKK
ncbi:hypothetical protein C7954_11539 [Halanaerobium congolense]|uniref:Glycosyltransferase 2-like domain-containing protein n=1 Tax=Halanaerobium congolense TaxID=54121 RepID=A0A4R8GHB5_9FIRM|nr:glycosyltransferase family 2 protein [Halanaerobium congolense]TDX43658.1 hypothetical protein C7954_11539 [Halanaerobium congolense]